MQAKENYIRQQIIDELVKLSDKRVLPNLVLALAAETNRQEWPDIPVGRAIEQQACPCGRGLPLMDMAAGRVTDFLLTPDGKIISGASLTIFLIANTPGLAQAQLVQEKKGEVTFRIVKNDKFDDESLRFLDREMPKFFGDQVTFTYEFVESIPVEASGKYRFSISKLDVSDMF